MDTNIEVMNAFMLSVFCILIVFVILIIISLSINLIKIVIYKCESVFKETENFEFKKSLERDYSIKFEEINDEDMMIAAFVASIDAVGNEDNKTVKIKSIKRI